MKTIFGTSSLMIATAMVLTFGSFAGLSDTDYRPYISTRLASVIMGDETPGPDTPVARCDGSGWITHGDGHRTKCPGCIACEGEGAAPEQAPEIPEQEAPEQMPPDVAEPEIAEPQVEPQAEAPKQGCQCGCGKLDCKCQTRTKSMSSTDRVLYSLGLSHVPNIRGYRPKVGVVGMSVRWHLETGARGEHAPVPGFFLSKLTRNQQFWLHDYLHGYASAPPTLTSTCPVQDEEPQDVPPRFQVLHFGAEWCGPCKRLKKVWVDGAVVSKLAQLDGEVIILDEANRDHKELFSQYKITAYPTVIITDGGKVTHRFTGARTVPQMLKILEEQLK